MHHPSRGRPGAFTLVELLVVVGIIAILIAILLPSLNAARRQANAAKCSAAMKELGNAFAMYAHDNRGYYPPACFAGQSRVNYDIDGFSYYSSAAIWHSFVAKYVTKNKLGVSSGSNDEAADARKTVIWGCPVWNGWQSTAPGGFDRTQSGYGMNPYPTLGPTTKLDPTGAVATLFQPPATERNLIRVTGTAAAPVYNGVWTKAVRYTRPGERGLLADSWNWRVKVRPKPAGGNFPGQPFWDATLTFTSDAGTDVNQTLVDVFRHGQLPAKENGVRRYAARGGKVGFNVLFADGHVSTFNTQDGAYDPFRMGNTGVVP